MVRITDKKDVQTVYGYRANLLNNIKCYLNHSVIQQNHFVQVSF